MLGVAVARRPADELQDDSGVASTSVAALLSDLTRWERARLPEGCVLVVDEAGMVATRQLAALVDAVDQADDEHDLAEPDGPADPPDDQQHALHGRVPIGYQTNVDDPFEWYSSPPSDMA